MGDSLSYLDNLLIKLDSARQGVYHLLTSIE